MTAPLTALPRARSVVVTGGAGFVGANLVRRLRAAGTAVRVVDDLSTGQAHYLHGSGAELVVADVRDRRRMRRLVAGADAVVHLAAAGSVVESVADPWHNFDVNVTGTLSVLDAARRTGAGKVVVASTGGAIVGDAAPPVDERTLPRPLSPYGASKAAAEAYCSAYAESYGLSTVALRFANVYGPYSEHKRGAVTAFLAALRDGRPLVVYGPGTASRDFLYVDDVCTALVAAIDTDLPGVTVLHVASGVETTVLELARLCRMVAGRPGHPVECAPARRGEVERTFASYAAAAAALGFTPTVALADGLAATWRWFTAARPAAVAGAAG